MVSEGKSAAGGPITPSACPETQPDEALFSRTQNPAEETTPMPKPVLTLAAAWAAFDAGVFDAAVANAEKVAARRVFYAGAQSVLDILLAGLEPKVEVTEREVDRVEALSDELRRFADEVEAGRA